MAFKGIMVVIFLVTTYKATSATIKTLLLSTENSFLLSCILRIVTRINFLHLIDPEKIYDELIKNINDHKQMAHHMPLIVDLHRHILRPISCVPIEMGDPFYVACMYGSPDLLDALFSYKHKAEEFNYVDKLGAYHFEQCLDIAITMNKSKQQVQPSSAYTEVVEKLLTKYNKFNIYNSSNWHFLSRVANEKSKDMFLLFLNHRPDQSEINKYTFDKIDQECIIEFLDVHDDLFNPFFNRLTNNDNRKLFMQTAKRMQTDSNYPFNGTQFIEKLQPLIT